MKDEFALNIVGQPPMFTQLPYMKVIAEMMIPDGLHVTAAEICDGPDEVEAATEILEELVRAGLAMATLMIVGDDKQWVYSRMPRVL